MQILRESSLPCLLSACLVLAGCNSNPGKPEAEAAPAPKAAVAPASERAPEPQVTGPAKPLCKDVPAAKGKATKKDGKAKTKAAAAEPDCINAPPPPAAAAEPPARAPVAAASAGNGGYDLSKNKPVTDSTKVEAGQGTQVKGINDWQGEISGLPAASSRFTRLKIGMSQKQVADLIGEPTDQGAWVTGKAFIPFYFGSDKSRWEMTYKGQGRLIFSNQAGFGTGYYLTWIIHNASEPGYR